MRYHRTITAALVFALVIIPILTLAQAAAVDPDLGATLSTLLGAVQGRNWTVVVGLALTLITFGARKWGGNYIPWFHTDRGGAALAIGIAVLGTLGTVLAAGRFSINTFGDALAMAMTNAGGYVLLKKLLGSGSAASGDAPKT